MQNTMDAITFIVINKQKHWYDKFTSRSEYMLLIIYRLYPLGQ